MSSYRLTATAEDDILRIFLDGVRLFGAAQANFYHDGLEASFRFLSETPRATRQREEINPSVRAYPYRAHIIIYELDDDDMVIVLRIRHGRENWLNAPI